LDAGGVGQLCVGEVVDRTLEICLGGLEGGLAVHHSCSGALAEILDELGGRCHERQASLSYEPDSAEAAISASVTTGRLGEGGISSAAAASLACVPAPSKMASAMREVMSRTERMASSLPGMG